MKKILLCMFLGVFSVVFLVLTFSNGESLAPKRLYQVYVDDQVVGQIKSKKELEEYFKKDGKNIKANIKKFEEELLIEKDIDLVKDLVKQKKKIADIIKYLDVEHPNTHKKVYDIVKASTSENIIKNLDKIAMPKEEREYKETYVEEYDIYKYRNEFLIPNGVEIRKIYTYKDESISIKEIYKKIQSLRTTSIMAYRVAIKGENKTEYVYVTSKDVLSEALDLTIATFVGKDNFDLYIRGEQVELATTGEDEYIESIFITEDITVKNMKCSVAEKIYTDATELSQYLLFSDKKNSSIYTVKLGDDVSSVALANKVSVEEIFMSNPDITSENQALGVNRKVIINELKPKIEVAVVKTIADEQAADYETIKTVDDSVYVGYQHVTQKGVKGKNRVIFRTYSLNGQDVKVEVVNKEVLVEPIPEKITVGGRYIPSVGSTDIWRWPTEGGWYISTYFGYRYHPIKGNHEFHKAIDIAGPYYGSRIFASNNGTVITATYHYSYGNYVLIDHNNGFYTLYAHMSRLNVKVGQVVGSGDVIGYLGSTGTATGPHLHYEVWYGGHYSGTPVNPLNLKYR